MLYLLTKATAFLMIARSMRVEPETLPLMMARPKLVRAQNSVISCSDWSAADLSRRELERQDKIIRKNNAQIHWRDGAKGIMPENRFQCVAKRVATRLNRDRERIRANKLCEESQKRELVREKTLLRPMRPDHLSLEPYERRLLRSINEWQSLHQAGRPSEDKRREVQDILREIYETFDDEDHDDYKYCRDLLTPKLKNSIPVIASSSPSSHRSVPDEFIDHVDLTGSDERDLTGSGESDDKQITIAAYGEHPTLPEAHSRKSSTGSYWFSQLTE
jgi:hypothetical protein